MNNIILKVGRINGITGTEPMCKESSMPMPNTFKIEYTVSIYVIITPMIINIHEASLVFGQSKMARKEAAAPRIS
jgi:hypothetical protein